MGRIWAVTKYTLAQCLRSKIAALTVVLLAAAVLALPFMVKGDGTLAGRIRTFLSYSTSVTALVLSLVTVLLSAGLLAADVKAKHVFLVAVKPVARWQFVVGRWLGVVLLDALLLAAAAGGIYAMAMHLRTGEAVTREDRLAVDNEVFVSRAKLSPVPVEDQIERLVAAELERLGGTGLAEAVASYRQEDSTLSEAEAREKVREDIRKRVVEGLQSLRPGETLVLRFTGVRPTGSVVQGRAEFSARLLEHHFLVAAEGELKALWEPGSERARKAVIQGRPTAGGVPALLRPEGLEVILPEADHARRDRFRHGAGVEIVATVKEDREEHTERGRGRVSRHWTELRLRMKGDAALMDRLRPNSYVTVDGVDGRVDAVREEDFEVRFFETDAQRREVSRLGEGDRAEVSVRPAMELEYKVSPAKTAGRDTLWGVWRAWSEGSNFPPYMARREDPAKMVVHWRVPDRIVSGGELNVEYTSLTPGLVSIAHKDVFLYYRVGGFEGNFARAIMLVMTQLIFLAAIGVVCASFLSFPVGCLTCFTLMGLSLARGFLAQAVKLPKKPFLDVLQTHPLTALGHGLLQAVAPLMPHVGGASPSDFLADATLIRWSAVGEAALYDLLLRVAVVLALACVIFRKRELARVQV
jgi:hypothetical protein